MIELPPLPPPGASGPEICDIMRRYMAVERNITREQKRALAYHMESCRDCEREYRLLKRVDDLVASLPPSAPSARVDQAVMAAIAARTREGSLQHANTPPAPPLILKPARARSKVGWLIAAAAVLFLALGSAFLLPRLLPSSLQGFALPTNLSWSGYVLYHTQDMMSSNGHPYQIVTYHNLHDNAMNVETVMNGKLDVVVVRDDQKTLGLDMMNHVAQWGADEWLSDETVFDLAQLRKDLQSGHAVYLGKDRFNGQDVYRVRCGNGQILLLNMQYQPVNVLSADSKPMYGTFHVMTPAQVSNSMWDMSMPKDFTMGQLPQKATML